MARISFTSILLSTVFFAACADGPPPCSGGGSQCYTYTNGPSTGTSGSPGSTTQDVAETATFIGSGTVSSEECAILTSGALKCWGWNPNGGLGYGDIIDRGALPQQMGSGLPAINLGPGRTALSVTTGGMQFWQDGSFACAILDNQTTSCWGANSFGQLGLGDTVERHTPPAVPVVMPNGDNAISVSTGAWSTCALLSARNVTCWGDNEEGELGYGDTMNRTSPSASGTIALGASVSTVSVGDFFACAVLSTGGISCWGDNSGGQLGVGDTITRLSPTPVALPANVSATSVSAGSGAACALLTNGEVMCWGYNMRGYVGVGDTSNRSTPVAVSLPAPASVLVNTCAVLQNGQVWCWGLNSDGNLGLGDTQQRNAPAGPVNLGSTTSLRQFTASGGGQSCARMSDGSVHCWGGNGNGQLGLGDTNSRGDAPTDLPFSYAAVAL